MGSKFIKKFSSIKGMATIEAIMVAVVGLPLIIASFSVYDIIDTNNRLQQLSQSLIADTKLKPYSLRTGDQIWILRPVDFGKPKSQLDGERSAIEVLNEQHRRIDNIVNTAEQELKNLLGSRCRGGQCPNLYRVELRMADVQFHTHLGRLRAGGILCEGYINYDLTPDMRVAPPQVGCNNGRFFDLTQNLPQHRYLRIRGTASLNTAPHGTGDGRLREFMYSVIHDPDMTRELNTYSGLYGAERKQHYGSSPTLAETQVVNYAPYTRIVALQLDLNLAGTMSGVMLRLIRAFQPSNKNFPKMGIKDIYANFNKDHETPNPDQVLLTARNHIVPRNFM